MTASTNKHNRVYQAVFAADMFLFAAVILILGFSRFKAVSAAAVPLWGVRLIYIVFDILLYIRRCSPAAGIFCLFNQEEAWDILVLTYIFFAAEISITCVLTSKGYAGFFCGIREYGTSVVFSIASLILHIIQDE